MENPFIATMTLLDKIIETEPLSNILGYVHAGCESLGLPAPRAQEKEIVLSVLVFFVTLMLYYLFFGAKHRQSRKKLERNLRKAMQRVEYLQARLEEEDEGEEAPDKPEGKEVRIFLDGAFDMMHYGHMNAFRQGRALGTHLVVGINSDESIATCKGSAPVMNDLERTRAVAGCKWVDEVLPECPYVMTEEYLDSVIKKYNIDYVVHGDDPCIVDGKDVYEAAKRAGKFKTIPRTEGVSTTDIVGRMLLLTKDHHHRERSSSQSSTGALVSRRRDTGTEQVLFKKHSSFYTTGRMIRLFSAGHKDPPPGARIVYMDGSFDMLHAGHMEAIQAARKLGDYLIVGVHNDAITNARQGNNLPILNINERVLSVLGCHGVDDVLIDSPYVVDRELIASLNISSVAHGSYYRAKDEQEDQQEINERYSYPISAGIFKTVDVTMRMSVQNIVDRIQKNEERYRKKFEKKQLAEKEYYDKRYANAPTTGSQEQPDTPSSRTRQKK